MCLKFFVILSLCGFAATAFPEPISSNFKFRMYGLQQEPNQTFIKQRTAAEEQSTSYSTKFAGLDTTEKQAFCEAAYDKTIWQTNVGTYLNFGSNYFYFSSLVDDNDDNYETTRKFISFKEYLTKKNFAALLNENNLDTWNYYKARILSVYNLSLKPQTSVTLEKEPTQNIGEETKITKETAEKMAKQQAGAENGVQVKQNSNDLRIEEADPLVYMSDLLTTANVITIFWIKSETKFEAIKADWKNSLFDSKTFEPSSLEQVFEYTLKSFMNKVRVEALLTTALSGYSADSENPGKKTFNEYKAITADTDFNFYLAQSPVDRTLLEIRKYCDNPFDANFNDRILFMLNMLYGVFVMHQKGYAHCNIDLSNFVLSQDRKAFHLIEFGNVRAYTSKKICRQTNELYQAREYESSKQNQRIVPVVAEAVSDEFKNLDKNVENIQAFRHNTNFELDAFAVGKAIMDMIVMKTDYDNLQDLYKKVITDKENQQNNWKLFVAAAQDALEASLKSQAKEALTKLKNLFPTIPTSPQNLASVLEFEKLITRKFLDQIPGIVVFFVNTLILRLLRYNPTTTSRVFGQIFPKGHFKIEALHLPSVIKKTSTMKRFPIKIALLILYEIHLLSTSNDPAKIIRISNFLTDPMTVFQEYKLDKIPNDDDVAPTNSQKAAGKSNSFKDTIERIRVLLVKYKNRRLII